MKRCPKCGGDMGEWKYWKNKVPTYFHSLENEIKKCDDCGVIVFKYKPEGNEER